VASVSVKSAAGCGSERRFAFGRNWERFLTVLDEERIAAAEDALRGILWERDLKGKSFLDVGSGSGLSSLAARRLGARVCSFDVDARSVGCTRELKRRHFPDDGNWEVREGSVLDPDFMTSLGEYDVVYAWGTLHHTGDMWRAMENSWPAVRTGGRLLLAIYNDQGRKSDWWRWVKRRYCAGAFSRVAILCAFVPYFAGFNFLRDAACLRDPRKRYREYKKNRGMSAVHDWLDWLGGYPYEVATPGEILEFLQPKGFRLVRLRTTNGRGNNQIVFRKQPF